MTRNTRVRLLKLRGGQPHDYERAANVAPKSQNVQYHHRNEALVHREIKLRWELEESEDVRAQEQNHGNEELSE